MNFGNVSFYDSFKGYGFIRREKGRDVIFSYDDITNHDAIDIPKGLAVKFEILETNKGLRAVNILVV